MNAYTQTLAILALCLGTILLSVGCGTTHQCTCPPPGVGAVGPARQQLPQSEAVGLATWYGNRYHGRTTASGEIFDQYDMTAAHRTLPFGSVVRVTDRENMRSIVVRINDRGPTRKERIIDLSKGAAEELGMIKRGVIPVVIEVLEWGNGKRQRRSQR